MKKALIAAIFLLLLFTGGNSSHVSAQAAPNTPDDLIQQTNNARTSYGYSSLKVDPLLMACAQNTAEIMAAKQECKHIMYLGYASTTDRAKSLGYGGRGSAFVTENIACDGGGLPALYEGYWSDYEHMRPINGPQAGLYQHVGAGVAQNADGYWYYVVQVGYASSEYVSVTASPSAQTPNPTKSTSVAAGTALVTATALEDGSVWHIVQPGETWSTIAQAYGIQNPEDLKGLNNRKDDIVYADEKILIRLAYTATPTPTITSTPLPPTNTRQPTNTLAPATLTRIPAPTITPTPLPFFPEMTIVQGNRRVLGIAIIAICLVGLLYLWVSSRRK